MRACQCCHAVAEDGAAFCTACGAQLDGQAVAPGPQDVYAKTIRSASDGITTRLGLERIEGFSFAKLVSEVFGHHEPDAVERLLSVGTPDTTPALDPSMGVMPSPWVFARVLMGALLTYLVFLSGWNQFENLNLIPGLIMVGSFAMPFSVLVLFFELNTPKNVSLVKLIQMLLAGGALSLLLALFLNAAVPFLGILGMSSAGIIEEVGKLAALLLVMRFIGPERYPYRLNGLLMGAAVGTGFAAFESAGYALRIGLQDGGAMLDNIMMRGVLSPFGHIAWTAIAASAYWIAATPGMKPTSVLTSPRFLKLFAVPVTLHFIWNLPFTGPFMFKYVVLGFVAWVIIISLVQSGLNEVGEAATRERITGDASVVQASS